MKTTHERFDEDFGEVYSKIDNEEDYHFHFLLKKESRDIKAFIDQEIERAVAERENEIVEWLNKRCEENYQKIGTAKWNVDMEELIKFITNK